jgi:hypothetical protein
MAPVKKRRPSGTSAGTKRRPSGTSAGTKRRPSGTSAGTRQPERVTAVTAYKSVLKRVVDNRPSGTRQAVVDVARRLARLAEES